MISARSARAATARERRHAVRRVSAAEKLEEAVSGKGSTPVQNGRNHRALGCTFFKSFLGNHGGMKED